MKTVKKLLSLALAVLMIALALPSLALQVNEESTMKNAPCDAANLNVALNVPGGNLNFQTSSDYPWVVEGDFAISTNSGMALTSSSVWTNVTTAAGDMLGFEFWVLGEGEGEYVFDGLQLIIDGSVVAEWWQTNSWQSYSCALSAGNHEIRFTYKKDYSIDGIYDLAMLDNVYVGQQIMPSSIAVSQVSVAVGRRAFVNYAVYPDNAMDTSCTFSTANPSIATVDASGVVSGVSVGTTTVTVTSVADPSVYGTASVTVTEATGGVELEGFALMDFDSDNMTYNWVSFYDSDPSYVEATALMPTDTYGAAYYNGNVYGYLYGANDSRFFVMNAETHQVSYPGGSSGNAMVRGMAYNYANDTMYAIVNDALATVDLASGALNIIADFTGSEDDLMTIAIDGEGNAYGLTLNSMQTSLVRINLNNAVCTVIGELAVGLNFAQSMTWDHGTNTLYWARELDVIDNGLYKIDVDTLSITSCGTIGRQGMEISCLYTTSEPGEGLIGDADVNGTVTIADAVLALRHAMGLSTITGQGFTNADVDNNGTVTTADAVAILRMAMGLA
ncbi:MAG: dockerin type I repeat-containing protein [Clostridia bacterium]|nr:dockerin type I repeat-containing protein [Clostridia bacterium]